MTVLVTGGQGMLGQALGRAMGEKAVLVGRQRCDVRDMRAVADVFNHVKPQTVIHAAAMTDVDGCEADEATARDINVNGTRTIAEAAASRNCRLILISTDYVFSGNAGNEPLSEDDLTGPLSAYGRTKLAAEGCAIVHHDDVSIVRLSATYGPGGKHFPGAILSKVAQGEPLRVVDDQIVSPSYVDDVASAIGRLVNRPDLKGVFHCANEGAVSWFAFAKELLKQIGKPDHPIKPVSSSELGRPAPRPRNSALDSMRIQAELGIVLRGWAPALRAYLEVCGSTIS